MPWLITPIKEARMLVSGRVELWKTKWSKLLQLLKVLKSQYSVVVVHISSITYHTVVISSGLQSL